MGMRTARPLTTLPGVRWRAVLVGAFLALFAAPASAATLTATASCNQQWVNVTVQYDGDGWVMARKPGKDWFISGDRFVPDIGATSPASDYDITLEVEVWDTPTESHKVLAATSVRTPNCAPTPTTTTTSTTTTRPVFRPVVVQPELSWLPAIPSWLLQAIVEAVRGLP